MSIWQRVQSWPRAMQWAVLAGLVIIAFLAYDETIRPLAQEWDAESEAILDDVGQIREAEAMSETLLRRQSPAITYGEVVSPNADATGRDELLDAINEIVGQYPVTDKDYSLRPRGQLKRNMLPSIARGKRIERIDCDLRFTAKPQDAIAILTALESHPAIEAVTEIRISNPVSGKVSVRLTAESWVISTRGSQV